MNHHGDIRPIHGRLDVAPFVGVFFLMLPLLLFHTSLVFKPGIEVSADRIRTMSFGEDRPADPELNDAAYSRNRRGEFVLLKPKPGS